MAEFKIDIMKAGAIGGALLTCGALGTAGLAFLDWRIGYVIDQRENEKRDRNICDLSPTGDPEEDAKLARLQASIGGCD